MKEIVRHWTAEASRRPDQPRPVLGKHLEIDPRSIIVALELGQRGELQEVAIAGFVLGQEQQVIRLALLRPGAAFGKIGLDSDNRVQACIRCRLIPLHRSVHDPMVSNRDVVDA
jgi:hypothetical protein